MVCVRTDLAVGGYHTPTSASLSTLTLNFVSNLICNSMRMALPRLLPYLLLCALRLRVYSRSTESVDHCVTQYMDKWTKNIPYAVSCCVDQVTIPPLPSGSSSSSPCVPQHTRLLLVGDWFRISLLCSTPRLILEQPSDLCGVTSLKHQNRFQSR